MERNNWLRFAGIAVFGVGYLPGYAHGDCVYSRNCYEDCSSNAGSDATSCKNTCAVLPYGTCLPDKCVLPPECVTRVDNRGGTGFSASNDGGPAITDPPTPVPPECVLPPECATPPDCVVPPVCLTRVLPPECVTPPECLLPEQCQPQILGLPTNSDAGVQTSNDAAIAPEQVAQPLVKFYSKLNCEKRSMAQRRKLQKDLARIQQAPWSLMERVGIVKDANGIKAAISSMKQALPTCDLEVAK